MTVFAAGGMNRTPTIAVVPQDLEAEMAVLGAILIDPKAIARFSRSMSPVTFSAKKHAEMYLAALELERAGVPTDIVTIGAKLENKGALESIGGRSFSAHLEQAVPTAANVDYYASIVAGKARRRRIHELAKAVSSGECTTSQS